MYQQAIQNLITGNIFGSRSQPTQKFAAGILDVAPQIYDLYGEQLGENWIQQYLPAAGGSIAYPLRQAMQQYEEAMAPKRGVMNQGQELYSRYQAPTGQKTLPTQLGEAAHDAWKLAQGGQWYNPMEDRTELMPSVQRQLGSIGSQYFGTAETAQLLEDMLSGASNWSAILPTLSDDNPYKGTLQSISAGGKAQPTSQMLMQALAFEGKKAASASGAGATTAAKPKNEELFYKLAALATDYPNKEAYRQHIANHAGELIARLGPDLYNRLLTEATRYAPEGSAGNESLPWYAKLFSQPTSYTGTGEDLIGNFIKAVKQANLW